MPSPPAGPVTRPARFSIARLREGSLSPGGNHSAHRALLWAVLAFAAAVRLISCWAGLPYLHHWDEPQIASRAIHMMQTGSFDPDFFNYGSLPIYLCMLADIPHYLWLMSRPETAPPFLSHLSDIKTSFDTGWHWTISHPTFYLWNRWIFAGLGTASVWLAYLLGRRLWGRWAGLAAATVLAGTGFHVEQSAKVGVDIAATFFVLGAAYLSVLFVEKGRLSTLLAALAACGFAASCKYNAALAWCMPVLALVLRYRRIEPGRRGWLLAAAPAVPAAAFLIGTPFALFNLAKFLQDVGSEVHHYKVRGQATASAAAGLPNLELQLEILARNMGPILLVMASLGLLLLLARRSGWVALILPAIYVPLMVTAKPNFHRNFLILYPYAAIGFGVAAVSLVNLLRMRGDGRSRAGRRLATASVALLALLLTWRMADAGLDAWRAAAYQETRTVAMARVRSAGIAGEETPPRVGIPEELRVHESDLGGEGGRLVVRPYADLLCDAGSLDLMIRPQRWRSHYDELRPLADLLNILEPPGWRVRERVGSRMPLMIDSRSTHPALEILERAPAGASASDLCVARFAASDLLPEPAGKPDAGGMIRIRSASPIATPWVFLEPGSYAFLWRARRAFPANRPGRMDVNAEFRPIGAQEATVEERSEVLPSETAAYVRRIDAEEGGAVSLRIVFPDEDASAPRRKKGLAFLSDVHLFRLNGDD